MPGGDEDDNDIKLFYYDPIIKKPTNPKRIATNVIYGDLEREATQPVAKVDGGNVAPSLVLSGRQDAIDSSNADKIKSIAFNSREVRLVGPDQKEVEMKDDVATKMIVALDNLQKEASVVWGQVNTKLDKGWTDFKAMIEEALAKKPASVPTARYLREAGLVVPSGLDGYAMADEPTTGDKIKGFLTNIGINEDNQKKASETLTKAGATVSDAVTKDIPDALKKAGESVSETLTKDLPDAWNKMFGK